MVSSPTQYETLSAHYRAQVLSKLPAASLLPPHVLSAHPPGSDVSLVPETCGLLSPSQMKITRMDATELIEQIAKGALSAEEVVTVFGIKTAIAHQLVCCLTDFWLDEAIERAKELDAFYKANGRTVGPLHGLPISLKDQFPVQGHITSCSFLAAHVVASPSPADGQLSKILRDAGAVFYCHSNLPQTIMHLECESFWGRTLNPFNTNLTSGGSSGGESALLAMKASPFGLGTDIGGSVRGPAGNTGLFGFRPTALRVPGAQTYVPGRDSVMGVAGPFAHSSRDLELFFSVVLGPAAKPWRTDASLIELAWRGGGREGGWEKGGRKLRVGVMRDDGEVRPLPPLRRALDGAVEKLKRSGEVEVVEFAPWKTREGWELIRRLYFIDGGKRIHQLTDLSEIGEPVHHLTRWLLEEAGKPVEEITDTHDLWKLNMERDYYRSGFAAHWNAIDVDVVLCPVSATPAPRHGTAKWWAYTSMWNIFDCPSVAFPTGLVVDSQLDQPTDILPYLSQDEELLHHDYTPEDFTNAPLGLQLVARRFRDEELMDALKVVEKIMGL